MEDNRTMRNPENEKKKEEDKIEIEKLTCKNHDGFLDQSECFV